MNLSLILLGLVGLVLGVLVLHVLMRLAYERDSAARHEKKRIIPFPKGDITRWSHG